MNLFNNNFSFFLPSWTVLPFNFNFFFNNYFLMFLNFVMIISDLFDLLLSLIKFFYNPLVILLLEVSEKFRRNWGIARLSKSNSEFTLVFAPINIMNLSSFSFTFDEWCQESLKPWQFKNSGWYWLINSLRHCTSAIGSNLLSRCCLNLFGSFKQEFKLSFMWLTNKFQYN